ncbi:hypothetical protein [Flavobacterium aciduliphilum]|uniref:Uncharacterized protein n=1 Tax=Flavobacterium aciduliphilum TaxID=1101402 RepID=A0A328YLJ9_9FLAO|nr:hypothetical protein [Flavobacterium aciduliphilum]RAR73695.1 hypothetical protein CLV55_10314 [Flavobacterium aciduliphilum]
MEVPPKKKYQRKVTDITKLHYITSEGMKISVYSPYEIMVKEIMSLGINPKGKTIKELQNYVSQICLDTYMNCYYSDSTPSCNLDYLNSPDYLKRNVIRHYLNELSYWLYDYNVNKMPDGVRVDFELSLKRIIR